MQQYSNCLICNSDQYKVIYKAKGDYFFKSQDKKENNPSFFSQKAVCVDCGLVFQNPLPTQEHIQTLYSKGYSSQKNPETFLVTEKFLKEKNYRAWDQFQWIEKIISKDFIESKGKVLEIGSSAGLLLHRFQTKGWQAEGVEPSKPFADYAFEQYGIKVHRSFFEETKLPTSEYDFIILSHMLEHVSDPISVLKKVKNYLKPTGFVYIEVPNIKGIWKNLDDQLQITHLFIPSINVMKRLSYEAGLEVIKIEEHKRVIRCLLAYPLALKPSFDLPLKKDHYKTVSRRLKFQRFSSKLLQTFPFLEKFYFLALSNTVTFTLCNLIAVALGFVSSFSIRHYLGPFSMGLYSELMLGLQYAKFHHLGVMNTLEREIPFYRGKKDSSRVEEVKKTSFLFIVSSSLIISGILAFACLIDHEYQTALFLVAMLISVETGVSFYETLLQSYKQFKVWGTLIVFSALIDLILKLFFVSQFGLHGLLFSMILTGFFTWVLYLKWGEHSIDFTVPFRFKEMIRLVKVGIPLLVFRLLYSLSSSIDRFIIMIFLGRMALGYYSVVTMVSNCFTLIPKFSFKTFFPHIMETFGRSGNVHSLKEYLIIPHQVLGCFFAVLLGICILTLPFFIHTLLPRFEQSIFASQIIVIATFFSSFIYTWNMLFMVLYKQKQLATLYGIGTAITFVTNLFFMFFIEKSIEGVAYATLLSQILFTSFLIIRGYQHYSQKVKDHVVLLLHLYFPVIFILVAWFQTALFSMSHTFQNNLWVTLFHCGIFLIISFPMILFALRKFQNLKEFYISSPEFQKKHA